MKLIPKPYRIILSVIVITILGCSVYLIFFVKPSNGPASPQKQEPGPPTIYGGEAEETTLSGVDENKIFDQAATFLEEKRSIPRYAIISREWYFTDDETNWKVLLTAEHPRGTTVKFVVEMKREGELKSSFVSIYKPDSRYDS